jgi:hypothetical protein
VACPSVSQEGLAVQDPKLSMLNVLIVECYKPNYPKLSMLNVGNRPIIVGSSVLLSRVTPEKVRHSANHLAETVGRTPHAEIY